MKGTLVSCLLFAIIATVYGSYVNNRGNGYPQVNNNYNQINNNNAGYGLNNNNYATNSYAQCRALGKSTSDSVEVYLFFTRSLTGTPSQNIADCCSQSSAPIDRSNLNKCCLAQGKVYFILIAYRILTSFPI